MDLCFPPVYPKTYPCVRKGDNRALVISVMSFSTSNSCMFPLSSTYLIIGISPIRKPLAIDNFGGFFSLRRGFIAVKKRFTARISFVFFQIRAGRQQHSWKPRHLVIIAKGRRNFIYFVERHVLVNTEPVLMEFQLFHVQPFQFLSAKYETVTYNTYICLILASFRIKRSMQIFQSCFFNF